MQAHDVAPDSGAPEEGQAADEIKNVRRSPVLLVLPAALLLLGAAAWGSRLAAVDLLLPLGLALTAVFGYLNGANTVAESVATLVAGEVTDYRRALAWGAGWTIAGCLASAIVAAALVATLTRGLLAPSAQVTETFAVAVLTGTILWMALATRLGLPVAATHSLVGGLVLVAVAVAGVSKVRWLVVLAKVALPIAISPLAAALLALVLVLLAGGVLGRCGGGTIRAAHWMSSAAASFARGLNEGPKVVAMGALLLVVTHHAPRSPTPFWIFGVVALSIGLGSYLSGRKVTRTLAEKLAAMNETDAFTANVVTAVLVGVASNLGLPLSNAEVGSGAVTGVGLRQGTRNINWSVVRDVSLGWVVSAPAGGLLALLCYEVMHVVRHL